MNQYTKKYYKEKYAFASDYMRLLIIEQNGRDYFNMDAKAVRTIDVGRIFSGNIPDGSVVTIERKLKVRKIGE